MSFADVIRNYSAAELKARLEQASPDQVRAVLAKPFLQPLDFLLLLSPAASGLLEEMARKAHALTLKHFGRNILLYTPLYLSNYCVNRCTYCHFHAGEELPRRTLSREEVLREGQAIAAAGFRHLLLLTGESRRHASLEYLCDCIEALKPWFSSLGLEIYPLTEAEYRLMVNTGADSLTIYQEVYDRELYASYHLSGPKQDYDFRLDAPERACRAGMRRVNIGALLGLGPWQLEAFWTGLHAHYLQKAFPEVEIALSVPRLRPLPGGQVPYPVSDRELVQIILAYRLLMPQSGITVSTRERAELRDNLVPLGVTTMSAGSRTTVGGYASEADASTGQFSIADERPLAEIKQMLLRKGYQPVFKDWPRFC